MSLASMNRWDECTPDQEDEIEAYHQFLDNEYQDISRRLREQLAGKTQAVMDALAIDDPNEICCAIKAMQEELNRFMNGMGDCVRPDHARQIAAAPKEEDSPWKNLPANVQDALDAMNLCYASECGLRLSMPATP